MLPVLLFLTALGALTAAGAKAYASSSPKKSVTIVKYVPPKELTVKQLAAKYASAFGVPLSLVMAIMGIESAYNPSAENHSANAEARGGAWGLGQMTLATAKDITQRYASVAKKFWPSWNGTGQGLLSAQVNAAMTAFLLSLAWKKYMGRPNNWLTAGVAHHQGTGTIDKLLAEHGQITPDVLPPKGREYYVALEAERAHNNLVASLIDAETSSGTVYA